jgi:hypothetical protein
MTAQSIRTSDGYDKVSTRRYVRIILDRVPPLGTLKVEQLGIQGQGGFTYTVGCCARYC